VHQISYFDFFRGKQTISSTVPVGADALVQIKAAQAGER
jgi:hypothetical protein